MKTKHIAKAARSLFACIALLSPVLGQAQILAMVNYESKPGQTPRREGIAIIDQHVAHERILFEQVLAQRFPEAPGTKLFQAPAAATKIILHAARFCSTMSSRAAGRRSCAAT